MVSIRKGQTGRLEHLQGAVPTPRTTPEVVAVHDFEDLAREGRAVAETRWLRGRAGCGEGGMDRCETQTLGK